MRFADRVSSGFQGPNRVQEKKPQVPAMQSLRSINSFLWGVIRYGWVAEGGMQRGACSAGANFDLVTCRRLMCM